MAFSTCGKCGGRNFELKEVSPNLATYKSIFVQCTACGVPAGVIDYTNAAVRIDTKVKELDARLSSIEDSISRVQHLLQRMLQT